MNDHPTPPPSTPAPPDKPSRAPERNQTRRLGFLALGDLTPLSSPPVVMERPNPKRVAAASPRPPRLAPLPRERRAPPRPRQAVKVPIRSQTPPVFFRSQSTDSPTLSGSSLSAKNADAAENNPLNKTQQRTTTVLCIAAPRPTSVREGHRVELRVFVFFDGQDVVRYGLYCDVDGQQGFDGSGRAAGFSVEVKEEYIVQRGPSNLGAVGLHFEGHVMALGRGTLRFEGDLQVDGSGAVSRSEPTVLDGVGRALLRDGVPWVGWW